MKVHKILRTLLYVSLKTDLNCKSYTVFNIVCILGYSAIVFILNFINDILFDISYSNFYIYVILCILWLLDIFKMIIDFSKIYCIYFLFFKAVFLFSAIFFIKIIFKFIFLFVLWMYFYFILLFIFKNILQAHMNFYLNIV